MPGDAPCDRTPKLLLPRAKLQSASYLWANPSIPPPEFIPRRFYPASLPLYVIGQVPTSVPLVANLEVEKSFWEETNLGAVEALPHQVGLGIQGRRE